MTDKVEPTEQDIEMSKKGQILKDKFLGEMVGYRQLYSEDTSNDYIYFLYMASIMNYVEFHNGGCLSEWGMKSLALDISMYITLIQTGEPKLAQKDLVKFLLNLLNSYASTILGIGLIEFSREDPIKFFELNEFPTLVREDFKLLEETGKPMIDRLKKVIDAYCSLLNAKHKTIFNEEKRKGFIKPIFAEDTQFIKSKMPSNLENAKLCC